MFTTPFSKSASAGDHIECEAEGFKITARISLDEDTGPPWKEHDGHGPVSEWTSRPKNAGERVLSQDGRSFRYYDFAGAVAIAKRDKWGGKSPSEAAERDFEAMRAWCNDSWFWCGIVVTVKRAGVKLGKAALWGIDCNHPHGRDNAYLLEVANELLPEAIDDARNMLAKLCNAPKAES
jgi:hypothetical protein